MAFKRLSDGFGQGFLPARTERDNDGPVRFRPRKTLPPTTEKRHHQMVAAPFLERVGNLLFTEQLTILRLSSLRFDTTVKSPSKIS